MKFFLTLFTAVCCSWLVFAQQDMTKQEEPELLHGPCRAKYFNSTGQHDDRFYITMKGQDITIYMDAVGRVFSGVLKKDNTFEAMCYFRKEQNRLVCTFTEDKVSGYVEYWDIFDPEPKARWEFYATKDDSKDVEQFWKKFFNDNAKELAPFDPETWWNATPERREDKKLYEMLREKECIEFNIRGIVVNPQGQPIPGVVIGISCRAWGLLDPRVEGVEAFYRFVQEHPLKLYNQYTGFDCDEGSRELLKILRNKTVKFTKEFASEKERRGKFLGPAEEIGELKYMDTGERYDGAWFPSRRVTATSFWVRFVRLHSVVVISPGEKCKKYFKKEVFDFLERGIYDPKKYYDEFYLNAAYDMPGYYEVINGTAPGNGILLPNQTEPRVQSLPAMEWVHGATGNILR